jgi:CDP-glucose 4,6-dehydratase
VEGLVMFRNCFGKRRVLITGHTGFKGAWLAQWLIDLGAEVHGLALSPNSNPALFEAVNIERRLASHRIIDIRDAEAVRSAVAAIRPEVVFHLAAQSLVRVSYREPAATWATNVQGTIHLLEALRTVGGVQAAVVVTSDKCYENREQLEGYREQDAMGGIDPYSSSKGAAEIAISSWRRSYFRDPAGMRLASARAGNVIGGGDWSADRIVVDFVRCTMAGQPLRLRNPGATRPWQHVLEPLSGYLWLAARLLSADGANYAEGWNFGPANSSVTTVHDLANQLITVWGQGAVENCANAEQLYESGQLNLDVSKAAALLEWHGIWNIQRTVQETVAWYKTYHGGHHDIIEFTRRQIAAYIADARASGLTWTH